MERKVVSVMDNSIENAEDYENLEKNYLKLKNEYEQLKQELHEYKRNVQILESTQNDYKNEIDLLQSQEIKQKQRYTEIIKELEKKMNDMRTTHGEEKQDLENLIASMELKIGEIRSEVKVSKDCNSTKFIGDTSSFINEILSESDSQEYFEENQSLKIKLKELENVNEDLYKKLQENTVELEYLKETVQNIRSELLEAKSNNQYLIDENLCIRSELESIKSKPLENNSKGNSLFAEVDDRRVYLQDKINKMNSSYLKLTQEKNQLENSIRHLKLENMRLLEKWKADICEIDDDDTQLKSSLRGRITHLEKLNQKYAKELAAKPWILNKTGYEEVEYFQKVLKEKNDEIKSLREMGVRQSLYELNLNTELTEIKAERRKWKLEAITRSNELELLRKQPEAFSQDPENENNEQNDRGSFKATENTTENSKSIEYRNKAINKGKLSDIQEANLSNLNLRTEKGKTVEKLTKYEVNDKENMSSEDQTKRVTFANDIISPKKTEKKNCKIISKPVVEL